MDLLAASIILEHISRSMLVVLMSWRLREINLMDRLRMLLPYSQSTIFFMMVSFLNMISSIFIIF